MTNDTIAAICTPPGEGGLAVLRVSGPHAFSIANKIFTGNVFSYPSHTAHFGKITSKEGTIIDEVVLLVMEEKKSYTGESTVEIMCHGSVLITQKILARLFEEGAVAAGPGEFTARAYRNGLIDLTQAEAVQALIAAKNEAALKAATNQLSGRLSTMIKDLQTAICDVTAIIEAWVDYPEEGLEFASKEDLMQILNDVIKKATQLSLSFYDGKRATDGISLCLAGAPNAGKSSLMNLLLGTDRAIVTEVAGTTRDLLTEDVRIGGHTLRLYDTAGIRDTDEVIEKEGIKRAQAAAESADIVIEVYDITQPIKKLNYPNAIVCLNKVDLVDTPPNMDGILLSCKNKEGVEKLKDAIHQRILSFTTHADEEVIITQERHFADLNEAISFLTLGLENLIHDVSPEFIALDLRGALKSLSRIIGIDITEEILGSIFQKFCVGK